MIRDYSVSILHNGCVTILDRASKLRGTYTNTGDHQSGDLYLDAATVIRIIRTGK